MYKNYEDYSQNDPDFLLRILSDRLFEDQEEIHFEDGSSYDVSRGGRRWWLNDQLHRLDGPAREFANGDKIWYLNGERHREDGPAIEYASGNKSWYLHGEKVSEDEYVQELQRLLTE